MRTDYLDSLGLVVDPELLVLCCEYHQTALKPEWVPGHLKSQHKTIRAKVDPAAVLSDLFSLGGHEGLPAVDAFEVIPTAFVGLAIKNGFRCQVCRKVQGTEKSIRQHHKMAHAPLIPYPSAWPSCPVQQLNSGGKPIMFEVTLQSTTELQHDGATVFDSSLHRLDMEMGLATRMPLGQPNAREVSPWLLKTKWHVHVEPFDRGELRALVAVPKQREFPGLKEVMTAYLKSATAKIDLTTELVLRKLNSPDPVKE